MNRLIGKQTFNHIFYVVRFGLIFCCLNCAEQPCFPRNHNEFDEINALVWCDCVYKFGCVLSWSTLRYMQFISQNNLSFHISHFLWVFFFLSIHSDVLLDGCFWLLLFLPTQMDCGFILKRMNFNSTTTNKKKPNCFIVLFFSAFVHFSFVHVFLSYIVGFLLAFFSVDIP